MSVFFSSFSFLLLLCLQIYVYIVSKSEREWIASFCEHFRYILKLINEWIDSALQLSPMYIYYVYECECFYVFLTQITRASYILFSCSLFLPQFYFYVKKNNTHNINWRLSFQSCGFVFFALFSFHTLTQHGSWICATRKLVMSLIKCS